MELSPRMLELATPRKPRCMGELYDGWEMCLDDSSNLTQHPCMFLLGSGAMLVKGSAYLGQRHT